MLDPASSPKWIDSVLCIPVHAGNRIAWYKEMEPVGVGITAVSSTCEKPVWLLKTPKAAESLEFWDSPP
jgi:hypothetical protein